MNNLPIHGSPEMIRRFRSDLLGKVVEQGVGEPLPIFAPLRPIDWKAWATDSMQRLRQLTQR